MTVRWLARKSNHVPRNGEGLPEAVDLWRAYDPALQHYQADLQLFSTRISLFLVIESALVALVGSGKLSLVNHQDAAYRLVPAGFFGLGDDDQAQLGVPGHILGAYLGGQGHSDASVVAGDPRLAQ
jgi:hypothetical protein